MAIVANNKLPGGLGEIHKTGAVELPVLGFAVTFFASRAASIIVFRNRHPGA